MKLSPSQCGQRFCVVGTTRGGWCPVQAYETAARERSSRRRFPTSMPAAQREPPSSSSMCTRMISSKELSAAKPSARPASPPARGPGLDDAHDRLVRLAADQSDGLLAGDPAEGLDLLAHGGAEAGHDSVRVGRPPGRRAWPHAPGTPPPSGARRASAGPSPEPAGPPPARPAARAGCSRRTRRRPGSVFPGRMQMVGSRIPMPSTNPRRV